MEQLFEKLTSIAKRRGFIFQGSEIYGGFANTWDYGPLGVELKNNIKQSWWQNFVTARRDMVGIDAAILMSPAVWQASGHVGGFVDPLTDCRHCKNRHRADKLLDEYYRQHNISAKAEGKTPEELSQLLTELAINCPVCGKAELTAVRTFNLMFKTHQGVIEDSQSLCYLRPETAQGIFVNFKHVCQTSRLKIPFGIAQIGKAFRNEISPGNFIFRTREFEQMEIEFFCAPTSAKRWLDDWQQRCFSWLKQLGLRDDLLRLRQHAPEELAHYSSATTDIEFHFPFGWGELWGIAHRGDYDLKQHQQASTKELLYYDPEENHKYLPHVIEPSLGVDRLMLALLLSAYDEEQLSDDKRVVLKLDPKLAPVKLAVLPLSKKLATLAEKIADDLQNKHAIELDLSGSIGKRYRRFDEIGTPFCLTVDFDSLADNKVTIRNRDDMHQERIDISQVESYLAKRI